MNAHSQSLCSGRRDPKLLATSAHGLKSSSAHIGAMKLSAMCAALEADARAGALVRAEPALASLTPRAREWEMTRYRAYQAQLAGQPIGETFRQATAFLNLAANGSSLSRT